MGEITKLSEIPGAIAAPPSLGDLEGAKRVPEPRVIREPIGEGALARVGGALNDTFSTPPRPGAEPLGRAVFQPKNIGEAAIREGIMAPISAISAPVRILTSAASGGVAAAGSGRSLGEAGWASALDAAVAGLAEGVVKGGGAVASKLGSASRVFKSATEAPGKALDALMSRLPPGKWFNVPSLGRGPMTGREAVEKLAEVAKADGVTYRQARAEIVHEMNRLDAQSVTGPKPLAGQVFKDRTAEKLSAPGRTSRVAETVNKGIETGVPIGQGRRIPVQGAIDTAATSPMEEGAFPVGLLGTLGAGQMPSALLHRLPYGRVIEAMP